MGCEVSENLREKLFVGLCILCWVNILLSFALLGAGLYINNSIYKYFNLVMNYNGANLPTLLMVLGILGILDNYFGAFVAFVVSNPLRRKTFRRLLIIYIFTSLFVVAMAILSGHICTSNIGEINELFKMGLIDSMEKYRGKMALKREVDNLQIHFACCGNDGYADWFKIAWITSDAQLMTEDTPYSCCSPAANRPCIHHRIRDNSYHVNYTYPKQVTLNKVGCRDAMKDSYTTLIAKALYIVALILVIQLAQIVLTRILQTSVHAAIFNKDPLGLSDAYLCCKSAFSEQKSIAERAVRKELLDQTLDQTGSGDEYNDHFLGHEFKTSRPGQGANMSGNPHRDGDETFFGSLAQGPGSQHSIPPPPPLPPNFQ